MFTQDTSGVPGLAEDYAASSSRTFAAATPANISVYTRVTGHMGPPPSASVAFQTQAPTR